MAEPTSSCASTVSVEKPKNGLAGLKHWPYDLRSGFMVAMISLPFSMGIAITSGAPPVCGITSAIIAGFVLPFLGGSFVTISGPAAGLAPALFAGMLALGHGNLEQGYPMVLVAILFAGILQVILAKFKIARLSALFPSAAIHGMLAAIGLLIIVKQIPLFMGQSFEGHDFWEILGEAPYKVSTMDVQVFGLGLACTAVLFTLAALPFRFLKVMPPPVWVFLGGTLTAQLFLGGIQGSKLIHVPAAPLANGIVLPNISGILHDQSLWLPLFWIVVTLLLIDGTESLATIAAVDRIDPWRRKSDPDNTLFSMGACNVCSSLLGGLTIIPGIVKSTANILGGGRTQWANFFNACFLLVFLTAGRELINLVPKCVLAAILLFIGFKLCRPKVWVETARVGWEQFVIFAVTVFVTVTTDLLIGIAAGVAVKYLLSLWSHTLALAWNATAEEDDSKKSENLWGLATVLFRNPVARKEYTDGVYHLYCDRPMCCFNLFHLLREMDTIPSDAREVAMHLSEGVTLIDHTTCETLFHYLEEHNTSNGKAPLEIDGLERMRSLSAHESSMRLGIQTLNSE